MRRYVPVPPPKGVLLHEFRGQRRRRREQASLLLRMLGVVVLLVSLFLPWWTESETSGSTTWTQGFGPSLGVDQYCSGSCSGFLPPPNGPFVGEESFAAAHLNATGSLYAVGLALTSAAAACIVLSVVEPWLRRRRGSRSEARRLPRALFGAGLFLPAVAASAVALAQPNCLNADAATNDSNAISWTPSPSPETSFWGGCAADSGRGICASGISASWGPSWGWDLVVVGMLLLGAAVVVLPGPEPPLPTPGAEPRPPWAQPPEGRVEGF